MRGLELHENLAAAEAEFVRESKTEPTYRLYSINDRHPAMQRVKTGGDSVAVELYRISPSGLASVLANEPPGLSVGKVKLHDGQEVLGVLGEAILCESGVDITEFGGWRNYIERG